MSINERFATQNKRGDWVARCNGGGDRPWFTYNERTKEFHYSTAGNLIRYTFEGAVRAADRLNQEAPDMAEKTWPKVGQMALHKGGHLDSRPVAEVSDDGKMIRLQIFTIVTDWVPAENYTYREA